jgi:tetrahydromethanopterin S-methyltransferase subunit D
MDIYTRKALYKTLRLIFTSIAVSALVMVAIDLLGISAVGIIFVLGVGVMLAIQWTIDEADILRRKAELSINKTKE